MLWAHKEHARGHLIQVSSIFTTNEQVYQTVMSDMGADARYHSGCVLVPMETTWLRRHLDSSNMKPLSDRIIKTPTSSSATAGVRTTGFTFVNMPTKEQVQKWALGYRLKTGRQAFKRSPTN